MRWREFPSIFSPVNLSRADFLSFRQVWDVITDQEAVDQVRDEPDAQKASKKLVEEALKESTDNITVLVIRFGPGGSASTGITSTR